MNRKNGRTIEIHSPMKQRPFCDQRPSMRTNVILQRPKIGQVIQTTRNLPESDFAYTPQYHDNYGVREIFQNWATLDRPRTTSRDVSARRYASARQDFPATNRAALRSGCITAKEFRDFKKRHTILTKSEANYDAEDDEYNRNVRKSMVHGIPTPVTTDMRDTLTWQFGRDAVERARTRQTTRHLPPLDGHKPRVVTGNVKLTKAARGETVKPPPPLTYGDTFKMRRFLAIDRYAIDDNGPFRR
jgi:hypothetical protein